MVEKEKYNNLIISSREKDLRSKSLAEMYKKIKHNLQNITYSQKREVLKMLVNKISIKGMEIDIHCNIPYKFAFVGQSTQIPDHFQEGWDKFH